MQRSATLESWVFTLVSDNVDYDAHGCSRSLSRESQDMQPRQAAGYRAVRPHRLRDSGIWTQKHLWLCGIFSERRDANPLNNQNSTAKISNSERECGKHSCSGRVLSLKPKFAVRITEVAMQSSGLKVRNALSLLSATYNIVACHHILLTIERTLHTVRHELTIQ